MKNSTPFLVCIAFLMAMTASVSSASAVCSTCAQEGDWSQSASSFLEGKPISDVPQESGPRAVRKTTSQFENDFKAAQEAPSSDANAAATAATVAVDASAANVAINLTSTNASPSSVNSGSPVKITAIFSVSSQVQPENQTEIASNASTSLDDELLTASATVKDSTGKDVGNVNLLKFAGNEYFGYWNAQVPAGVYNANIFASSPQGSGTFNNALQISVVASGNVSGTPAVKNLE
jgi:hypothetical protein